MDWTVCGWLWYSRNFILRKLGPYRSLFSTVFLILLFVILLCLFHIGILKQSQNSDLVELKPFDSIVQVVVGGESPRPNSNQPPQGGKNGNANSRRKPNKGSKKSFNHRSFVKKGGIGNRKDKLKSPWFFDSKVRNKMPDTLVLKKPNQRSSPYQEDAAVGDKIEWTKQAELDRRKEIRQRSMLVKRECEKDIRGRLRRHMARVYEHLKWVTDHDLIYCPVFKAGSTTWMKNLLTLAGDKTFNASVHARASSLFPMPNSRQRIENLLQKSLKFMIVRHPFERLLSAYRDKMLRELKTKDPYKQLQLLILEKYGHISLNISSSNVPSDVASSEGNGVHPTFLQFLYKVRDDMKFFWNVMDGTVVDPHWTPYWYSCAPCQIQYDIIAKIETLDLDQEFIIRSTNLQDILVNTRTHSSNFDKYSDSSTAAYEYFKDIPLGLLKELQQLYWPDFKLYGYSADRYYQMARDGA